MDRSILDAALFFLRYNSDLWKATGMEIIQHELKAEVAAALQIRDVSTTDRSLTIADSGDGTSVSELGSSQGFRA